jgi:hypothetical protein
MRRRILRFRFSCSRRSWLHKRDRRASRWPYTGTEGSENNWFSFCTSRLKCIK